MTARTTQPTHASLSPLAQSGQKPISLAPIQCFAVTLSPVNFSTASLALLESSQHDVRSGGWRLKNSQITQSNHANGLPNAKPDPRSNTTIQTLEPILRIDVSQRLSNSQVLRSVGIHGFALHFHSNNLDGLIPGAETTTQTTS